MVQNTLFCVASRPRQEDGGIEKDIFAIVFDALYNIPNIFGDFQDFWNQFFPILVFNVLDNTQKLSQSCFKFLDAYSDI